MKNLILFLFFSLNSLYAGAITIDENSSNMEILSLCKTYIDTTNTLAKEQINETLFSSSHQSVINLGIAPNSKLWIRCELWNNSNKTITKILEYANAETEDLNFYNGQKVIKDGMFHHNADRESIFPIFSIKLKAFERKVFYLSGHCKISTMQAKLKLYNKEDYLKASYKQQTILFLFFAVIITLFIYNFMLFLFTKDIVYFYYISYLGAMLFFESIYLGVSQLYFFSNTVSIFFTKATIGYISLLVLPMILFTMRFLQTQRFPQVHFLLKLYLYLLPIITIASFDNILFDLNVMLIFFPLSLILMFTAIYAYMHGVKEAHYYLVGWSVVIVSLTLSVVKSLGWFDATMHFEYMNEMAFMVEAFMFSIALAHRIRIINQAKEQTDKKLIALQQHEQAVLAKLVEEKTKDLQDSLEEKEILYKELNHRVKNNLQMILSLIKLQISKVIHQETKNELTTTKNRINSIAKLYELLYLSGDKNSFDTYIYCQNIVHNIQEGFDKDIKVSYSIEHNIDRKHSIYCGIILNELVTNSFKYAYTKSGIINIKTYKDGEYTSLSVADEGVGLSDNYRASLGMNIVETLAKKQLQGLVIIHSGKGVQTTIKWREDA